MFSLGGEVILRQRRLGVGEGSDSLQGSGRYGCWGVDVVPIMLSEFQ